MKPPQADLLCVTILRMRILHICSARSIGGGEKHVASLANGLAQRGHDVFAALAPDSPLRVLLQDVPRDHIIELPMRNALSLGSAWKLARFARSHSVQIIHAHVGRDYPLAALAAGRSSAQLVLTRHVMFPLGRVHKLTLRRTARVIAVSQPVADALRSQAIFKSEVIRVIHNGIDVEAFATAKTTAPPNRKKLRVGAVGELAPVKRHEDFVRVAQSICAERDDVEFIIAGEDKSPDGENRSRLTQLIADAHLEDRVQLAGWTEDVAKLLATLDLFVSTSASESFGMAVVEAMAAGIPVVATETDGACEVIVPGVTGRIAPVGDIDALAKSISELLSDPAERARLGANAQQAARQRFGLEQMVDETVWLYEDVVRELAISVPAP
ncbi:MAG TPA: glycosyltransferase family 4 protein [Pyrinomonadaceae bacterium]|nr:glycosyltransferase family 4 protein [Pyrinomonadaceae bacterium]